MAPDQGSKKKILVVDDEPSVSSYLETLLQDNGYETTSAANGSEGLEKARSDRPDLVTLDISMPEKSGVRFYTELKNNPDLASVPVVMLFVLMTIRHCATAKIRSQTRSLLPMPPAWP